MYKPVSTDPDYVIDLHGLHTIECKDILDDLCTQRTVSHARLIVGKGLNSVHGPVLPYFVKSYCNQNGIHFEEYIEGAIDLFLKL